MTFSENKEINDVISQDFSEEISQHWPFFARDVKLSAFNLIAEANLHLFINLADNKKVL